MALIKHAKTKDQHLLCIGPVDEFGVFYFSPHERQILLLHNPEQKTQLSAPEVDQAVAEQISSLPNKTFRDLVFRAVFDIFNLILAISLGGLLEEAEDFSMFSYVTVFLLALLSGVDLGAVCTNIMQDKLDDNVHNAPSADVWTIEAMSVSVKHILVVRLLRNLSVLFMVIIVSCLFFDIFDIPFLSFEQYLNFLPPSTANICLSTFTGFLLGVALSRIPLLNTIFAIITIVHLDSTS